MNIENIPTNKAPEIAYEPAAWAARPGEIEQAFNDSNPLREQQTVPPPARKDLRDPFAESAALPSDVFAAGHIAPELGVGLAKGRDGELVWKRDDDTELEVGDEAA